MHTPHLNWFHKKSETPIRGHKFTHRIWRDPYVDWVITLSVAMLLIIFFSIMGIRTYSNVGQKILEASASTKSGAPTVIDTRSLTRVLDVFEAREAERDNLARGYQGPSDPSI